MEVLNQISFHLQQGDEEEVFELTKTAIEQGISPKKILDQGLIAGMDIVGEKFKIHEVFLPEVLMSARAMCAGMDQLKPLLIQKGIPSRGIVVIGTVQGDLHDIGKNLVSIMLKGAGFEVIDLGKDVSPEKFINSAIEHGASIIGMSALLTTTMPVMKEVVDLLKREDLSGKIKTIIGGAPVSKAFANEIGANEYCYDAGHTVERVKEIMEQR